MDLSRCFCCHCAKHKVKVDQIIFLPVETEFQSLCVSPFEADGSFDLVVVWEHWIKLTNKNLLCLPSMSVRLL